MNPEFFVHKMREVKSLVSLMWAKVKHDDEARLEAAENALEELDDERKFYENEVKEVLKAKKAQKYKASKQSYQDKVERESNQKQNRDISAI